MTTPYATAAFRYLTHGWKGPLPVGTQPGQKASPPTGYTGNEGRWPTEDEIAAWVRDTPDLNIAIRLPEHVVGLDVDDYDDKPGADTMTAATARHGLLPRTWVSTSRDGRSGIRWYRLSEPAKLAGKLVHPDDPDISGVEVIQRHHRYAVVPPSVHPEGRPYRWVDAAGNDANGTIPRPSDFPMLPQPWVDHIKRECSCWAVFDWNRHTPKENNDPVAAAYHKWAAKMTTAYGRHDAALGGVMALASFQTQGWPGADDYLERLHGEFLTSLGESRDPKEAEDEWRRMIEGAEAKAHTTTIPRWEDRSAPIKLSGGEEVGRHDSGNADILARRHGANIHYVAVWNEWLTWDGTHWDRDTRAVTMAELAKDVGRDLIALSSGVDDAATRGKILAWANQSLGAGRIRNMIELTRGIGGIPIEHETLDADPWLLGVANGVVDLRTGQHRPADPADLMTMQSPVTWDAAAEAPRWRAALQEWFPNPDTAAYVHRLVGQALVGLQRDHLFVIHYGTGGNGKGTFVRALQNVLGPYAATPDLGLLTQTKWGAHDTATSSLFRARLAVASETEKRVKLAEASIKNLTGGDRISARRLYENPWAFAPTHSLWLTTNYQPEITGRDAGIWRRIRVVPWTTTFAGPNADHDLDDALRGEAAGILAWAVAGVAEWLEHGLDEPAQVVKATAEYRTSEDLLGRFATDIGLRFGPDLTIGKKELADHLDDWAKTEGIKESPRADLGVWLDLEHGCREDREHYFDNDGTRKRRRIWTGVGILENPKEVTEGASHASHDRPDTPSSDTSKSQLALSESDDETKRGTRGTRLPETPIENRLYRDFTESPSHASHGGLCAVCDRSGDLVEMRGETVHRGCGPTDWKTPEPTPEEIAP